MSADESRKRVFVALAEEAGEKTRIGVALVRARPALVEFGQGDPRAVDDPDLAEPESTLDLGVVSLSIPFVRERPRSRVSQLVDLRPQACIVLVDLLGQAEAVEHHRRVDVASVEVGTSTGKGAKGGRRHPVWRVL